MITNQELIARNSIPEPMSGCWLWTGSVNSWGYGRLGINRAQRAAHRLSYVTFIGEIPARLRVLHRCDVPCCVNPDHLFLGTDSDNVQDCLSKHRHVALKGEANAKAKLSEKSVASLRERVVNHGSITRWAKEFGVSRRAIMFALKGTTWQA